MTDTTSFAPAEKISAPDDSARSPAMPHEKDAYVSVPAATYDPSTTPSASPSTLNALIAHADFEKPKSQPPSRRKGLWIRFWLGFTVYRQFFAFILTFNLIVIVLTARGRFHYADTHSGSFLLGNILMAIMIRNELFLRCLYFLTNLLFAKWAPLSIRLGLTSALQHVGGIHSGCATSGLAWILYRMVMLNWRWQITSNAVIAMGFVTTVALLISIISAFPYVRNYHHNTFERYHRFIGWLGIAVTWAFVYLGNCYDNHMGYCDTSALHLIKDQEFWFIAWMTVFVVIPWVWTRKVEVVIELPSSKVAIMRFKGGMRQGLLGRVSRTALLEYHAFGIVSESPNAKYHYMICGVQGDFTKALVSNPPTHMWTRKINFAGVSNTSTLYKRGIRICTGTGIGAGLSTCLQNDGWFLIWIGSDLLGTFGKTIWQMIENGIPPERRILWDSKKIGRRPDTMDLLENTYRSWGAEVVFITSNAQGNYDMMLGCKERGIPVFGTLFDF